MSANKINFLVFLIISMMLINSILCAPQENIESEGSKTEDIKVALDDRINVEGLIDGVVTMFNGAKQIYKSVKEDEGSTDLLKIN